MLKYVNNYQIYNDNFSKKNVNYFRFINSSFGLQFLLIQTQKTSQNLSKVINIFY